MGRNSDPYFKGEFPSAFRAAPSVSYFWSSFQLCWAASMEMSNLNLDSSIAGSGAFKTNLMISIRFEGHSA